MSSAALGLDISHEMCLRCTVDNKSHYQNIYSSEFNFKGGGWKLNYYKVGIDYNLLLCRCSGVPPPPLHVAVYVESSVNGRIASVLPEETRFTTQFKNNGHENYIWQKGEEEILRSVPEFRLHGVLKLIVVMKLEDSQSIVEAIKQSSSTRSTSVQTTLSLSATPCLENLSKDFDRLRMDDSHHDVEFHCAGHTTKAHKLIVCQRSPVIASMLSTHMVEGRTGIVSIPDMAPDIFAHFMRYLYCGRVEELTFDSALRLYEAGDQYEVLGLAKRCSDYLMEHLSIDNAYEVLVVFDAHNNKECVEKMVDFMVENRVPLVSGEWSAFCDEHCKLAIKVLNRSLKAAVKSETSGSRNKQNAGP